MKKISFLIFTIITILSFSVFNINASSQTGHKEYNKITFPNSKGVKLLVDMTNQEKNAMIKQVKRKAFGWSSYCLIRNEEVLCEADTMFSRSNLTSESYKFTYKLETGNTVETSYCLSGDLGGKINIPIKKISAALDLSIKGEYEKKEENKITETTSFTININPNTRTSLVIMVEGLLSSGASRYYILGISFKKGTWEYIEPLREYYELHEEIIKK